MNGAQDRVPADAGITLIEVLVSMAVMSIAMSIFTGAVVEIYRTTNKTESLSAAQAQTVTAFQRLDREVRYASGISAPNSVPAGGPDYYVEYLLTDAGTDTCVQLRLQPSTNTLQRRTWVKNGTPFTPTAWRILVSSVGRVSGGAADPFTFVPAAGSTAYQALQVDLEVTTGAGVTATRRETKVTFVALNTSPDTVSATVCSEGR